MGWTFCPILVLATFVVIFTYFLQLRISRILIDSYLFPSMKQEIKCLSMKNCLFFLTNSTNNYCIASQTGWGIMVTTFNRGCWGGPGVKGLRKVRVGREGAAIKRRGRSTSAKSWKGVWVCQRCGDPHSWDPTQWGRKAPEEDDIRRTHRS